MKKVLWTMGFIVAVAAVVYFTKGTPNTSTVQVTPGSEEVRQPSAAVDGQQAVIDEMTKIILSIADKSEVLPKVNQVLAVAAQKDPQGQMPGVQLLAGYMKMIPGLEGVVYRCRPIVEPSDWLHMSALTTLRSFRYNSYLYGKHILALFDFVTTPSHNAGPEFKTVTEAQQYLVGKAAPLLESLVAQARAMENLPAENFNFKLDRTLFIGLSDDVRFLDRNETVKQFIKPNLYSITFALQRTLGSLYYWSALNVDDMPAVASEVVAATTINEYKGKLRSMFNANKLAKGVTPIITFDVIKKYPNYFSFRDLNYTDHTGKKASVTAQTLLDRAYTNFFNASYYEMAAFNCIIQYTVSGNMNATLKDCANGDNQDYSAQHAANGQDFMFNPNALLIDYKIKKAALVQRYKLYAASNGSYADITSEVTGKSLSLNVKALFSAKNSPRNFFPTAFAKADQASYQSGIGVHGWNYDHGFPIAYGSKKDFTFGGFFNPAQVSDSKSLNTAMATIVYTRSLTNFAVLLPVPSPVIVPIPILDTMTVN